MTKTDDRKVRSDDPTRLPPMSRTMQVFAMSTFFALGAATTWLLVADPLDLLGDDAPQAIASIDAGTLHVCPMHPEVVSEGPADCPICGMDLVPDESGGNAGTLHVCPMHPEVVSEGPADCPICGMDLVPDESAGGAAGTITIDPVQVQNIGVVTEEVVVEDVARMSHAYGILDYDADRVEWVNTRFSGWIEKTHVSYVGQKVRRGDPLFDIYSPELVTTQQELLDALSYRDSLSDVARAESLAQAERLVEAARSRLASWEIGTARIAEIESGRSVERSVTVDSPRDGVLVEIMNGTLKGMRVEPGMKLYKIADLSTVWVHADVHERDIPWIRPGQSTEISFRNDPGGPLRGEVLFLYPEVSAETRTLKVCIELGNAEGELRPGMFADVTIRGPVEPDAVVVPRSAILRTGERDLGFVSLGEGKFEPRELTLGLEASGGRVQILEGLEAGERIVTQAHFLLDSESRMQEAIDKFRSRRSKVAAPNGHGGHGP